MSEPVQIPKPGQPPPEPIIPCAPKPAPEQPEPEPEDQA
jgi:hypothetical protein